MTHTRLSFPAGEKGFTLIEVIMAIVIIGIASTAMINVFSGVQNVKKPEYVVQGSFLALKQMEAINKQYYDTMPAAGSYTCAQFSVTLTLIDCSNVSYTFNFVVENATMTTPNVSSGVSTDPVKKVTTTVSRNDNAIGSMTFYTMYSPLSTE